MITILDEVIPLIDNVIRTSGCDSSSFASIRTLNLTIAEMAENKTKVIEKFVEVGRRAINEDSAHVLIGVLPTKRRYYILRNLLEEKALIFLR
ncbi:hypothetical protein [Peribacillus sp. NPDC096540]|uniref:hypothetical protein n=1 Tax=Peribacillus sp. NPDC096540 TaxID=3390612 RepID=UPI003D06CBF4